MDFLEFSPHAFFIPRYPEGREATVYWPTIDNKWKNDTPYGMLLQTWVEGGNVHGRVWSTKYWDVAVGQGSSSQCRPPRTIRDDSLTCYPQQANAGFDVTVTATVGRPGSSTLVRSEPVTTHYVPEDEIICTNPTRNPELAWGTNRLTYAAELAPACPGPRPAAGEGVTTGGLDGVRTGQADGRVR